MPPKEAQPVDPRTVSDMLHTVFNNERARLKKNIDPPTNPNSEVCRDPKLLVEWFVRHHMSGICLQIANEGRNPNKPLDESGKDFRGVVFERLVLLALPRRVYEGNHTPAAVIGKDPTKRVLDVYASEKHRREMGRKRSYMEAARLMMQRDAELEEVMYYSPDASIVAKTDATGLKFLGPLEVSLAPNESYVRGKLNKFETQLDLYPQLFRDTSCMFVGPEGFDPPKQVAARPSVFSFDHFDGISRKDIERITQDAFYNHRFPLQEEMVTIQEVFPALERHLYPSGGFKSYRPRPVVRPAFAK